MDLKMKRLREILEAYGCVKNLYVTTYSILAHIRDDAKEMGQFTLEDVVNFIYVIREISRLMDDLRKEADGIAHLLENIGCALYITMNKTGPIRASLATGSPDVKTAITLPKRKSEPDKYKELLKFFGVSPAAVDSGVIKAYWPGICERITQLCEEAKPLPSGISPDKTYSIYSMRIKMIQNLDEVLEQMKHIRMTTLEQAERKEVEACNEFLTKRPTKK